MRLSAGDGEFITSGQAILVLGLVAVTAVVAYAMTFSNIYWIGGAVLGITLFVISFLKPTAALHILIMSMLLSPEFGTRSLSGEGFTLRFEDLLLFIMGFSWLAKNAVHKDLGLAIRSPLNRSIGIYILLCLVATIIGIIRGTVDSPLTGILFVLKYFEYFVIFFITINNINSREQLKHLLITLFITYLLVTAIGLAQVPMGHRISAPFEGQTTEPNTLGGYLLLMLSLNITFYFCMRNRILKTGLLILAFSAFIAMLYTLSRSSWIGLAVMYVSMVFYIPHRKILVTALILGALIAPMIVPQAVTQRIQHTFQGLNITDTGLQQHITEQVMERGVENLFDSSTEARLESIMNTFKDFRNYPVVGYGVTGYVFIDAQYNRVLIETGLLGLLAFIYLLYRTGSTLMRIKRRYHNDPLYCALTIGTICAFFGLLAHAIGTNTFIIVRIMEPFWCIVGLNFAIPLIEEGSVDVIREKDSPAVPSAT